MITENLLEENKTENIRLIVMSDIHYCNEWYGITPEIKRDMLCTDLQKEYKQNPYQALLLLGDYSLDHWAWDVKGSYLTKGVSNTKLFVEHCLPKIAPKGVEVRMIAGNHEQYGDAFWYNLTGHNRKDYIVCGPVLFILLDTFGGNLDPLEHSDGTYIGVDIEYVKMLTSRYPNKKVVLCAHWFDMAKESEEVKSFIANNDRILCLFCGHNHLSKVTTIGEEYNNKPIIYTGHYSYSGEKNPINCLNGYREVVITKEGIKSKYIVPSHTYAINNAKFTNEYAEQDDIFIKF